MFGTGFAMPGRVLDTTAGPRSCHAINIVGEIRVNPLSDVVSDYIEMCPYNSWSAESFICVGRLFIWICNTDGGEIPWPINY